MRLRVREMEVFRQVMETGSVTLAARNLGTSQPAISKMLHQVEDRLGFALFVRDGRRLRPTAEAQALFPETVKAFAAFDVVQRLADDLQVGRAGILTVVAISSLANSLLPPAIQRFRAIRPHASVVVQTARAPEVTQIVGSQAADLGAVVGPVGEADVRVSELGASSLACLLPREHPLAARETLTPAELEGVPLICPGRGWPIGTALEQAFANANVPLRIAMDVPQATIAAALVRTGAGVAVLDGFGMMCAAGPDLVQVPLLPHMPSVARLLEPRYRPLSRLAREFRSELLSVAQQRGFR